MKNRIINNVIIFFSVTFNISFLILFNKTIEAQTKIINKDSSINKNKILFKNKSLSSIKWQKLSVGNDNNNINWERVNPNKDSSNEIKFNKKKKLTSHHSNYKINSLNRSIVIGEQIVGPDISWLVPPGFKWTNTHKLDASIRGYNQTLTHRRKSDEGWGWNKGDAVGQFYYQFFTKDKYTIGTNIGMRSVNSASLDGYTPIGDGLSAGFRFDYQLSNSSGFAVGAEQLLHFDGVTDTGRDLYITASKAFWRDNLEGKFPLKVATGGIATGRLAEGTIKGLCSNLFGGAGTEVSKQRRLCWAPVFSLSYLFNKKLSTFFEYNSRFFLLGTSLIPFERVPLRGTFALTIADHIHNYKLNNLDEMTWTFRLSLGY